MWQGWSAESGEEQTYVTRADTLVIIDDPLQIYLVGKEETSKNVVQTRSGEVDLDKVDLDNGSRLVNPVVATKGLIDSEQLDTCLALQLSWSSQDLKGLGLMASDPAAFPAFIFHSRCFVWSVVRDRQGQGCGGGGEGLDESNEYCLMLTDSIFISLLQLYQQYHLSVDTFSPSLVDAEHSALNIPPWPTLPTFIHTGVYFALHHAMSQ